MATFIAEIMVILNNLQERKLAARGTSREDALNYLGDEIYRYNREHTLHSRQAVSVRLETLEVKSL